MEECTAPCPGGARCGERLRKVLVVIILGVPRPVVGRREWAAGDQVRRQATQLILQLVVLDVADEHFQLVALCDGLGVDPERGLLSLLSLLSWGCLPHRRV